MAEREDMFKHNPLVVRCCGKASAKVPWSNVVRNPGAFIEGVYLPAGQTLKDPEKLVEGEVMRILEHWRQRQTDEHEGITFAFRGYQTTDGTMNPPVEAYLDGLGVGRGSSKGKQKTERKPRPRPKPSGRGGGRQENAKAGPSKRRGKLSKGQTEENEEEAEESDESSSETEDEYGYVHQSQVSVLMKDQCYSMAEGDSSEDSESEEEDEEEDMEDKADGSGNDSKTSKAAGKKGKGKQRAVEPKQPEKVDKGKGKEAVRSIVAYSTPHIHLCPTNSLRRTQSPGDRHRRRPPQLTALNTSRASQAARPT